MVALRMIGGSNLLSDVGNVWCECEFLYGASDCLFPVSYCLQFEYVECYKGT